MKILYSHMISDHHLVMCNQNYHIFLISMKTSIFLNQFLAVKLTFKIMKVMWSQMKMMSGLSVHIVKRQPSRREEKAGRSRVVRRKIVVMDNS